MESAVNMSIQTGDGKIFKDERCIPDFIKHWSETRPNEEAFVFLSRDGSRDVVTWRDLYLNSVRYAKAFISFGVKEQDIVGIGMTESPEWLFVNFGVIFAGAITMALLVTYKDGSDVVTLLNKLEKCSTLVLDPEREETHWPTLRSFLESVDKNGAVASQKIPSLKYLICSSVPENETDIFTVNDMLNLPSQDVVLPALDQALIAVLFRTSGTTGEPKAVAHTHATLAARRSHMKPSDRFYDNSTFTWIQSWPNNIFGGYSRICRSRKAETGDNDVGKFTIDAVRKEGCTQLGITTSHLYCVMNRMTELQKSEPDCFKGLLVNTISTSGQPVSMNVVDCLGWLCSTLIISYGSTETLLSLRMTLTESDCKDYEQYCCGSPVEGVEVKIVDDDENVVPVNTRGEMLLRSPRVFVGYFNDKEKTRSAFTSDGWYRTGDVGRMTENGKVFVEGRKTETIICRDNNISPAPLERVLDSCPGIMNSIVVPIPHEVYFQEICACVILESGSDVTLDEVKSYCDNFHTDKIEEFSILPAHYLSFDSFPLSRTGKVDRKQLAVVAAKMLQNSVS